MLFYIVIQTQKAMKKYIVGQELEVFDHGTQTWKTVTITRVSDSYLWFPNSGYQRIKISTIEKFPTLFRVK